MKSKFYNSNILTEVIGKTFTMGIKNWEFDGENNRLNYNTLLFYSDYHFDVDSFREKPTENNNPPPKPKPEKEE